MGKNMYPLGIQVQVWMHILSIPINPLVLYTQTEVCDSRVCTFFSSLYLLTIWDPCMEKCASAHLPPISNLSTWVAVPCEASLIHIYSLAATHVLMLGEKEASELLLLYSSRGTTHLGYFGWQPIAQFPQLVKGGHDEYTILLLVTCFFITKICERFDLCRCPVASSYWTSKSYCYK